MTLTVFVDNVEWFVFEEPNEGTGSTRLEMDTSFYVRWKNAQTEFMDCQEELRKLALSIGEVAGPMSPSKITHELNPE